MRPSIYIILELEIHESITLADLEFNTTQKIDLSIEAKISLEMINAVRMNLTNFKLILQEIVFFFGQRVEVFSSVENRNNTFL